jgi:hypothetical protein
VGSSQQPRSEATAADVQQYLLASRWYADTTKNSYFGNGPLCSGAVGVLDTLDFISTTRLTMTGKDGRRQEAQWEARNVFWGLNSTPGVQLFIDGREFPVMYATRDTMVFDTPWLDADCGGFRMLAKTK